MMSRKALSMDVAAVIFLVAAILVVIAVVATMLDAGLVQSESFNIAYNLPRVDMAMQGIMQGFEKTAIFFGLIKTTQELGAHGGVGSGTISAAKDTDVSKNPKPKMDVTDDVSYLAVSRCKTVGSSESEVKKRMPLVFYEDKNMKIGTTSSMFPIVSVADYPQNIKDVAAGGYDFSISVQVFLLKKGTVKLKICQPSLCANPSDSIIKTVTESGATPISISKNDVVKNAGETIALEVSGDVKDVAILRQVAVSIYDKNVVSDPNALLTKSIEDYRAKLTAQNPSGITTTPLKAAFIPAGKGAYGALDNAEGFAGGLAWAPDEITSGTSDTTVSGWGVAEEDAKVRYWKMYGLAEKFVNGIDNPLVGGKSVKKMLLDKVNSDFADYSNPSSGDICQLTGTPGEHNGACNTAHSGTPPASYSDKCPDDTVSSYNSAYFYSKIEDELKKIEKQLNDTYYITDKINWTLTMPLSMFAGCTTNADKTAAALDSCTSQNIEYYEYKKGEIVSGVNCYGYGTSPQRTKCTIYYNHRYILKNLPIKVTITDEKYKTFDSATNTWVKPTFTFFAEVDKVDDNLCGSGGTKHACDTTSGGTATTELGKVVYRPPTTGYQGSCGGTVSWTLCGDYPFTSCPGTTPCYQNTNPSGTCYCPILYPTPLDCCKSKFPAATSVSGGTPVSGGGCSGPPYYYSCY